MLYNLEKLKDSSKNNFFSLDGGRRQLSLDAEDEGEDDEYECYYIGEETDSNIDSNNESFEVRMHNKFQKGATNVS